MMQTKKHDIVVIIPAYNEELTIRNTVIDFYENMNNAFFLIIDNNSIDKTGEIANQILKEKNINGIVIREFRQGKGYAIRRAFQEIEADIYIMTDADTTYSGKDLVNLIKPIINHEADIVVGDRHKTGAYKKENKRLFHKFGNTLVKKIINFLFNSNLNDIMSGYRVMNRLFVKNYPILSSGFEIETDMTLHRLDKRFRIIEIPITYKDRPTGSFSKLNTFTDGFQVLKTIIWIFKYYKPFIFFGSMSLLFFILGLLTGFPVLYEYYKTRYILHIPLAILTTGIIIMSLISFSIGLVL